MTPPLVAPQSGMVLTHYEMYTPRVSAIYMIQNLIPCLTCSGDAAVWGSYGGIWNVPSNSIALLCLESGACSVAKPLLLG